MTTLYTAWAGGEARCAATRTILQQEPHNLGVVVEAGDGNGRPPLVVPGVDVGLERLVLHFLKRLVELGVLGHKHLHHLKVGAHASREGQAVSDNTREPML